MKYSPPSIVYLYYSKNLDMLNINDLSAYIQEKFLGINVVIRTEYLSFFVSSLSSVIKGEKIRSIARKLVDARVRNIKKKDEKFLPFPAEIEHEKKMIKGESKAGGILYDGIKLSDIYRGLISEEERMWDCCHIVLTDRLFGSWDANNKRYHARVSVYSYPSLVSARGLVEAPAKPREFYLKLQMGFDVHLLNDEYKDRFIRYDDERMTEAIKGYFLQALFFHSTGKAFCKDNICRLFNAHWQEDVIRSQLGGNYELCGVHEKMLKEINIR